MVRWSNGQMVGPERRPFDHPTIRPSPGGYGFRRFSVVGCAVMLVSVLVILGFTLYSIYRSPYYQGVVGCMTRMKEAGAALERYSIKNEAYPAGLSDLVPEYTPAKMLHCPLDPAPSDTISYAYTRPGIDAPGDTALLSCNRHKLGRKSRRIVLYCLKNGDIVVRSEKRGVMSGE